MRSPKTFTLRCERREDGGLRITSEDLPGLLLSSADPLAAFRDLPIAIDKIQESIARAALDEIARIERGLGLDY